MGMKTAGFVLVGGRSSRMGRDKARLLVGERFLVQRVAATVGSVTDHVTLVGPLESYSTLGFPCIADLRPGLGPLAGLEAALAGNTGASDTLNLVVGCDMPDLQAPWLEQLLALMQSSNTLCVVAKDSSGKTHPLCAVYRSACLPFIRQALDSGRLRMLDLLATLQAVEAPVDGVINNVNTPQEWAAWQSQ